MIRKILNLKNRISRVNAITILREFGYNLINITEINNIYFYIIQKDDSIKIIIYYNKYLKFGTKAIKKEINKYIKRLNNFNIEIEVYNKKYKRIRW